MKKISLHHPDRFQWFQILSILFASIFFMGHTSANDDPDWCQPNVDVPLKYTIHVSHVGNQSARQNDWLYPHAENTIETMKVEFDTGFPNPLEGLSLELMCHMGRGEGGGGVGDVPDWAKGATGVAPGEWCYPERNNRTVEGFAVRPAGPLGKYFKVSYKCSSSGDGADTDDRPTYYDGEFCGTRGQRRALDGLKISLKSTGECPPD